MRCIKLDATPAGRPVYEKLGFRDEWTMRRWECDLSTLAPGAPDARIRAWAETDAPRVEALDTAAFGASRRDLTLALAGQSCGALTYELPAGVPTGFGMLRPGARAFYLGPIAAASPQVGLALVEALTAQGRAGPVFWDIPDLNAAAVGWAEKQGFRVQRSLTRMWLGDNRRAGAPVKQFALAGPELG